MPKYILILLSLCSFHAWAEDSTFVEQKKKRKSSIVGIVLPSRSPENGFYAQGGLVKVFKTDYSDSTLRASNVYILGLYSQLNQFRLSIGCDLFTPKEKYYIYSWIYYSYVPELFYGVGQTTESDSSEFISYRVFHSEIDVLKRLKKGLFAGVNTRFEAPYDFEYDKGGLFDSTYKGGANFDIYGLGTTVRYDSRDNVMSSKKGSYIDLSAISYNFGSDRTFKFTSYSLDTRKFFTVSTKRRQVWGIQGLIKLTDGYAPFRYLPNITTRAYHPNLYRDNMLVLLRNEFRFGVYKFIGMSVFSGLALSSHDVSSIDLAQTRWNIGTGLRLLLSAKYNLNLRVDYGVGERSSNYYVSFSDAF